jgi:hypothetical protein
LLTLASRSRFPSPFLSIRQGSEVVYSDTFWGTDCVQKGENFTETPFQSRSHSLQIDPYPDTA